MRRPGLHSRSWLNVLSIAALLVPAAGIAYLGAVSYRDERGVVSSQNERQRDAALELAAHIHRQISVALDEVEHAVTREEQEAHRDRLGVQGQLTHPLGRYWFWVDEAQDLRVPRAAPPTVELSAVHDRGSGCARGKLEECERELRSRTSDTARLRAGQRAEASGNFAEARRLYQGATGDDTRPYALLGLARVWVKLGDLARSRQALADLEHEYADRELRGLPARLVAATLRAEVSGAEAQLELAEAVLDGQYGLDPVLRMGVLARMQERLVVTTEDQERRRTELDLRIAHVRSQARAAAGLADELPELSRTATSVWRGRPATRDPARTLIYRRRAKGGLIGVAIDAPMLEQVVADLPQTRVANAARPYVLAAGEQPEPGLRTIAHVPLGTALPHLSLALVNPLTAPDPLDEVIRERSRRHVVYTAALAMLLGLGLIATVRSAARARELARLKSDFVSTVSHELKTPLTSIRMFAEMLEQGVGRGDEAKMARYHAIIVQESHRLGLLIGNLLDYAQIERGTRRYAVTRQRCVELARAAITTFETLGDPERGCNPITLEVSQGAEHAELETDREVVIQAVLNVISNAAKYGGATQPIEVLVSADGSTASIAVRDHGPGIPAVEQARIFREFYRAPEAYRSGIEGTGLGLALVKRHIEALGGSVEVDSKLGEGSTFVIKLPRIDLRRDRDAGPGEVAAKEAA